MFFRCLTFLLFFVTTSFVTTIDGVSSPATISSDNDGNFNVTAESNVNFHAPSVGFHAPSVVFDGFITVGNTVNVINVANISELVAAWQSLLGQPLSLPVTIQLANGTYGVSTDVTTLSQQPFGSMITIQGQVGDSQAVNFQGYLIFQQVLGIKILWLSAFTIQATRGSTVLINNCVLSFVYAFGLSTLSSGEFEQNFPLGVGPSVLYVENSVINVGAESSPCTDQSHCYFSNVQFNYVISGNNAIYINTGGQVFLDTCTFTDPNGPSGNSMAVFFEEYNTNNANAIVHLFSCSFDGLYVIVRMLCYGGTTVLSTGFTLSNMVNSYALFMVGGFSKLVTNGAISGLPWTSKCSTLIYVYSGFLDNEFYIYNPQAIACSVTSAQWPNSLT